jgi:hypothetical protein
MLPYDQLVRHLPVLFTAAFVAVLFIQSGLDKVFDRKGNLEWLTGHFSKTILAGMVPLMLTTITVLEIVTGNLVGDRGDLSALSRAQRSLIFLGVDFRGGLIDRPFLRPACCKGLRRCSGAGPVLYLAAYYDGAFRPPYQSADYLRASNRFDPTALSSAILFLTAELNKAISDGE